jgi:hypothetical protein
VDLDEVLVATFTLVAPHLTERQRRLLLGAAARALGHGGVSRVARLAEASRPTVRRGVAELDQPADPRGRIRQHQGPKRLRDTDPGLLAALDRLVEPDARGDPQSPLRWTCKSTRELAEALTAQGHPVSDDTVGRLLREQVVSGDCHQFDDGEPVGLDPGPCAILRIRPDNGGEPLRGGLVLEHREADVFDPVGGTAPVARDKARCLLDHGHDLVVEDPDLLLVLRGVHPPLADNRVHGTSPS